MAIPTKTNLNSTYGDEAKKFRELAELGSNRTTTGNTSWTSTTSFTVYDTSASANPNILNKGQDGLFYWLGQIVLINNLIDATFINALISSITKSSLVYGEDAGASDAYAIALEVSPTAYSNGLVVNFKANTANTGACSLNVNGIGAKTIKDLAGNDLQTGAISSGQLVTVTYNGTYFILTGASLIPAITKIANGTNVLTLPAATDTLVGRDTTDTLTNKTLTSPTITSPLYQGNIDGWVLANETWTYASASTFTVSGDVTSKYQAKDKIKLTQSATVKYFYIVNVAYSAPNTTITITGNGTYTLANASISLNYYSKTSSPQGFPFTEALLWSGSWSTGDIAVLGIDKWKDFLVVMSGQSTYICANRFGSTFRGIGGFASNTPVCSTYHLGATLSGTTLTLEQCLQVNHTASAVHGAYSTRTITEIWGSR